MDGNQGIAYPNEPPAYNEVLIQQENYRPDNIPNYFDQSNVPENCILLPRKEENLGYNSDVASKMDYLGNIKSYDSRLDGDTEELSKYFMSNLQPPKLFVRVHGTHTETRHHTHHTKHGTRTSTTRVTVTDFDIRIDLSAFVCKQWSRIACVPTSGQPAKSYKETLQEYASSSNKFKEITMIKQPLWNYADVTKSLEYMVRSTGYNHQIKITYPVEQGEVMALSSSKMNRVIHDSCCRFFLVLTCLCIIVAPVYLMSRKKTSNQIVADYNVMITSNEFYYRNFQRIQSLVLSRHKSYIPIPSL